MKILHVMATLAPRDGGPAKACIEMARAVAKLGHEVSIYTTNADGDGVLPVPTDRPVEDAGVRLWYFPVQTPRFWKPSWPLARALKNAIPEVDVVHLHSLYLFHDWVTGRDCRRFGVPYILRPHGTLDPFIFRRHRFRKSIMELAFQNRVLRCAAAIHYTTEEEMRLAEPYVFGAPGAVVPLGLDLDDYADLPPPGSFRARHPEVGDKKIVLFFSRINFKKGMDVLARAYGSIARARDDVHLVIAGPDHGFQSKVEGWLRDEGALGRTTFTGMLLGDDKLAVLRDADLFVLPSYSENFGIAVVEAMACRLPVIISDKVNIWREVETADAGAVAPPEADAFSARIVELLDDPARRQAMGEQGRRLVERAFNWDRIAERLEGLYQGVTRPCGNVPGRTSDIARHRAGGP